MIDRHEARELRLTGCFVCAACCALQTKQPCVMLCRWVSSSISFGIGSMQETR